jgi:hypothetical protein
MSKKNIGTYNNKLFKTILEFHNNINLYDNNNMQCALSINKKIKLYSRQYNIEFISINITQNNIEFISHFDDEYKIRLIFNSYIANLQNDFDICKECTITFSSYETINNYKLHILNADDINYT